MDDYFGISIRRENVSACTQLLAETSVVVDFSIENNPSRPFFVRNGLVACRQINYAQSSNAKRNLVVLIIAKIVWTAVSHRFSHLGQQPVIRTPGESTDPAHRPCSPRFASSVGFCCRTFPIGAESGYRLPRA